MEAAAKAAIPDLWHVDDRGDPAASATEEEPLDGLAVDDRGGWEGGCSRAAAAAEESYREVVLRGASPVRFRCPSRWAVLILRQCLVRPRWPTAQLLPLSQPIPAHPVQPRRYLLQARGEAPLYCDSSCRLARDCR